MGEKISGYTGISTSTFADDDLFDISVFTGSGYVTRKITGAQLKAGLSSSSLATDDQVIDEAERNIDLNGTSATDRLNIRDSLGNKILEFRGDLESKFRGDVTVDEHIALNTATNNAFQFFVNTNGSGYAFYVQALTGQQPTTGAYGARVGGSKGHFYADRVDKSGFWANNTNPRTDIVRAFIGEISGSNTSDNIGMYLDVQNGANNYAIDVVNGDIRVDGDVGLSNTYTFGGGSSGDVATMKFKNGILVEVTTVP